MTPQGSARATARTRALAILSLPLAAGLVLTGCSDGGSNLQQQWEDVSDKGYVEGDGSTTSIPIADRTDPVIFEGETEHGGTFSSDETIGYVTVVNFWYASCAPCRGEAADLVEVYNAFLDDGVQFVGVNTRDQAAQAVQFAEEFGVEYPSIMDTAGGRAVQRAFAGQIPLNAVPTTLVLDAEGRVAHRVVGQLAAASQLRTLVAETLAETSAAPSATASATKSAKG